MNRRMRTYTACSGAGIGWAVLLVLARVFGQPHRRNSIFLVFCGFAIGWLSAAAGARSPSRVSARQIQSA